MSRWPSWVVILLGAAGCATSTPPPELVSARRALARAQERSVGRYAPYELKRAEAALARAEDAQREQPHSDAATEEAIAAERASEKARVTSRVAQDAEALEHARRRAARLRINVVRSEQASREREREVRDDELLRTERRRAQVDALERLQGVVGDVRQGLDSSTLLVPARALFVAGDSKLLPAAFTRLQSIADALAEGPSYRMLIDVTASTGALQGTSSYRLAKQRAVRIREVLQSCGVPFESIVVVHRSGDASLIRLVVTERSATPVVTSGVTGR